LPLYYKLISRFHEGRERRLSRVDGADSFHYLYPEVSPGTCQAVGVDRIDIEGSPCIAMRSGASKIDASIAPNDALIPGWEGFDLFAGPIIAREVATSPRPIRYYVTRAAYAGLFFILMWTAWQSLVGWEDIRDIGLIARFGGVLFQFFVVVQLVVMLFFAPLAAATTIAHEKDRRTFVLLLMTDLSDTEIIIGKLVAGLLQTFTLLGTVAPVFFICLLLGGVSSTQVIQVLGITAAAGFAGGSLGLLVALWRDRTFQSLAMTVLAIVLTIAGIEAISYIVPEGSIAGSSFNEAFNPFRAVRSVLRPSTSGASNAALIFTLSSTALALILNAISIRMLRIWNPGRNEPREQREGEIDEIGAESLIQVTDPALAQAGPETSSGLHVPRRSHRRIARAAGVYRKPWANPILWREFKTRAYGAKPLIIKGAYVLFFTLAVAYFYLNPTDSRSAWRPAFTLIPMAILSLLLVNAQGVTALTSERDTGALDLLLVTELKPREFIFGKLHGVLYNTKEMIALPLLLTIWMAITGAITGEIALFIVIDFALLVHFSAMLGLHSAITYTNSRTAVANSLGTIFFLMVGILICAFLIILGDQQFSRQLLSFLIFIGAGSVALFGSMGSRNPSQAIALVALLTPFWSFYCVISMINVQAMAAFLVSFGIYGFALLAMLVPAVGDFDIALGRTNAIQG
jgi:ABC-type Na+ efflux pump permease subunit